MCISQGVELLFLWFEEHDSFRLNQDYKLLDWKLLEGDKSNEEEQRASIICALEGLEGDKVLSKCRENDTWILINSQKNSPRNVQLSPKTCQNIEMVVNSFLPSLDINISQKSDEKNITEADVIILLSVIQSFAKQLEELSGKIDSKSKKK